MLLNRLLLVAAQRGNGAKWWRSQAQDRQLLGARPQERHHRGSAGRMGCSRGPAPWFCTPQRAPIWPIDSPALWQSMLMSCARPLLYTDSAANESTDRSWYQRQGMLNLERAGAARGEQRGARDGAKGGHWVTRGVNRGGCLKRGRFALAGGGGAAAVPQAWQRACSGNKRPRVHPWSTRPLDNQPVRPALTA